MSERLFLVAIATAFGRALPRQDEAARRLSVKCAGRLADAAIDPSVGTVGEVDHNALADSEIGLRETEAAKRPGTWKIVQDIERWTILRMHSCDERRVLILIDRMPKAEA